MCQDLQLNTRRGLLTRETHPQSLLAHEWVATRLKLVGSLAGGFSCAAAMANWKRDRSPSREWRQSKWPKQNAEERETERDTAAVAASVVRQLLTGRVAQPTGRVAGAAASSSRFTAPPPPVQVRTGDAWRRPAHVAERRAVPVKTEDEPPADDGDDDDEEDEEEEDDKWNDDYKSERWNQEVCAWQQR